MKVTVRCKHCGKKIRLTRYAWQHISGMAAANTHLAEPVQPDPQPQGAS